MDGTQATRHCAFCLQLKAHKLCSGCHRRAYCSVKCQKEDWSPSGKGQGHKGWCKLEHGQEDVDWEVRPVSDKGLGVIAKRPIPALYRIIVESIHYQPDSHPAIADLFPVNGTLEEKFEFNSFDGDEGTYFALRIARCNHSCSPNASTHVGTKAKVVVLYACRDIEEGEEILIPYRPVNLVKPEPQLAGLTIEVELASIKCFLYTKWGITCPLECICNDPNYKRNVLKMRRLHEEIVRVRDFNPLRAAEIAGEIIAFPYDKLPHLSWVTRAEMHMLTAYFANAPPQVLIDHLKEACKIFSAIDPLSSTTKEFEYNMILFEAGKTVGNLVETAEAQPDEDQVQE